ncbi:ABC transporter permease [Gordonia sp. ABSL11-1]|uniref:ABC transporter permease n=1 Tax=Gordonia sp. ABSL11-1 TaxID=3053924 RepID=UPI002572D93B|nr:ABC transporter permease [Gordonia sp. ABSL11-1]MDL9948136.1 ABC transporter permease [Gordonia sp. ABSL11-1]
MSGTGWRTRLRDVSQVWPLVLSGLILGVFVLAALYPTLLASGDPNAVSPGEAFQGPSVHHWFGTDNSGRDLYTRVVHGTRPALLIGLGASALGLALATLFGFLGGLGGRTVDTGVTWLLQILFSFPSLVLALFFVTIAGPGTATSAVAVGLATAPGYARIFRTQVVSVDGSGYVEAATVLGRPRWTILRRHIFPNVWAPLVVLGTLGVGQAIVWASSLSFLGLGVTPPTADWGSMLADGRRYINNAIWLSVFPGIAIVIAAGAATVLGRSLQRRKRAGR